MTTITPLGLTIKKPSMNKLFPKSPTIETLATGFRWPEGPIWIRNEKRLVFSDVSGNTMYTWNESDGLKVFRKPSGYANGNTLDPQGRLISCEHANRRVSRTETNNSIVSLATHYNGKKLNSPNDVVVRSDGTIYFTDPPDGLTENWGVPGEKELDFQGVYRISPTGELTLEVKDFQTPNGLAFSPDEKLLFIDDTDRMQIRVFDVASNGSLKPSSGSVFAELDPSLGPGWPDGLKVDTDGDVFVTGPTGIWVFDRNGDHLGIIHTPITPTNMNWGGEDGSELFFTAAAEDFSGSGLYRILLNTSGN